MKPNVTEAVARLHARLSKTPNAFRAEILEEALNRLLAEPNKTGSPQDLIDAAIAFAHMRLGRRARVFQRYADEVRSAGLAGDALGPLSVEAADIVSKLRPQPQRVLTLAWSNNDDVAVLATELGKSIDFARQSLSRARAQARALWRAAA